jgi:DNA-binding NtrC family response regulator
MEADSHPCRVLMADDDEDHVVLVRAALCRDTPVRFIVDWAASYTDALAQLANNRHDVALVDYRLDAHDGVELLREAAARGSRVPAVLMTGLLSEEIEAAALEAGAVLCMEKGLLDASSLLPAIRAARDHRREQSIH